MQWNQLHRPWDMNKITAYVHWTDCSKITMIHSYNFPIIMHTWLLQIVWQLHEPPFCIVLISNSVYGDKMCHAMSIHPDYRDFRSVSSSLRFQSGTTTGDTHCINLNNIIIDDTRVENQESFTIQFYSRSGARIVGVSRATITIVDNDGKSKPI